TMADQLSEATGTAAAALLWAVKSALYPNPKEASGDIGHLRGELWDATEHPFYEIMAALAAAGADEEAAGEEADRHRAAFATILRDKAFAVFDRWAPVAARAPEPLRRRVAAPHHVHLALGGHGKLGRQIFTTLGVPLPTRTHPATEAAT